MRIVASKVAFCNANSCTIYKCHSHGSKPAIVVMAVRALSLSNKDHPRWGETRQYCRYLCAVFVAWCAVLVASWLVLLGSGGKALLPFGQILNPRRRKVAQ